LGLSSRLDAQKRAVIAGALHANRSYLQSVLEQRGISMIEEGLLDTLSDLAYGDIIDPSEDNPAKKAELLKKRRLTALEKAQEMVGTHGFYDVYEEIDAKNPQVSLLLYHLTEINQIEGRISSEQTKIRGLDFLKDLLMNKRSKEAGFIVERASDGEPIRVFEKTIMIEKKKKAEVATEKAISPKFEVEEEDLEMPQAVDVFVAKDIPPAAPISVENDESEEVSSAEESFTKEDEDKNVALKETMFEYFDQIYAKDELRVPASTGMVTRAFQKLTYNTLDPLIKNHLVPIVHNPHKPEYYYLDEVGIATALHLSDKKIRGKLPKRQQRHVQKVAAEALEEYKEKKSTSQ
jgi:hypothetical protein